MWMNVRNLEQVKSKIQIDWTLIYLNMIFMLSAMQVF